MRARRIALKTIYWLAVLAVSLVIVFALVLLFESLDDADVGNGGGSGGQEQPQPPDQPPLQPLPEL